MSAETVMNTPSHAPTKVIFDKVLFAGGQIGPIVNSVSFTADNMTRTWNLLMKALHPVDVFIFSTVGFVTVPFFGFLYANFFHKKGIRPYNESYVYQVANLISQVARLAILVYAIDCALLIAVGLGIKFNQLDNLSYVFAKVIYIIWAANRVSKFKRYLIGQAFSRSPEKLGHASIIDRLIDGLIYTCTGLFLLDILDVEMGVGVKSMFAFGSAGTLVVGLASKDLATMFVNGLALSTTNRVAEGDDIRFGDGTNGTIQKIGWIHTVIKNYDNLVEVVPNSQLGMQRVKNLSRIEQCRVQQNLRFKYEDVDKLPKILKDIVEEIKSACPTVITDGTKPLRAVWAEYREDHLKVVVTAHFNCKPIGQKFWETQQECLFAINRAVKKNDVEFVTTFYPQPSQN